MTGPSSPRYVDLILRPDEALHIAALAREVDTIGIDPKGEAYSGDDPVLNGEDFDDAEEEQAPEHSVLVELRTAVESLNVDAQRDLLALLWIGRGDFESNDWSHARRQAREVSHLHVGRYLAETPLASDYLIEGLSALGYDFETDEGT